MIKRSDIFCLITDFGHKDMYVGQMKCVIYQTVKDAKIIDISHDILPHNILQGSFFLISSWPYLPDNSISIVVVDPGVGSSRNILIMETDNKIVIAPDNGILYPVIERYNLRPNIYSLDLKRFNDIVKPKNFSSTFHGRDVFSPVATYIALANDIEKIAKKITKNEIRKLNLPKPVIEKNKIDTQIIHIDRFGNCVTTIEEKFLNILSHKNITIMPFKKRLYVVKSYSFIPKGEIGILNGSQGYLEISLCEKSFAEEYKVKIGDKFTLKID